MGNHGGGGERNLQRVCLLLVTEEVPADADRPLKSEISDEISTRK